MQAGSHEIASKARRSCTSSNGQRLNGTLEFDGASYAPWSMVYADRTDPAFDVRAGPRGLEALVLNFPRLET